jgi:hypothetical protein
MTVAKPRVPIRAVSQTASIPAPVGGLNARDALANMDPQDAVIMRNWWPSTNYIEVRNGSSSWATGLPGWVQSLMTYSKGDGTRKLFAASGTGFYDVSSAGAVGAAVVSGLTNAQWEYANIATAGGSFFYAANGVDSPRYYDGTTWVAVTGVSTPAITGVTTTALHSPTVWKNRLWFAQKDTLTAWYLPTSSIGGAASSLNLTALFKSGGYLTSIFSATIDNANGIDDYLAFITSEGEVAVYRGSDPSTLGAFGLVGLYRIGRPLSRRCSFRIGNDVVLLCADGALPFSKLLFAARDQAARTLTDKIQTLINNDVMSYASNYGWQGVYFPMGNKVLLNVPQTTSSVSYQYAANTVTGAWTLYTGWNAACWDVYGDRLMYGGNGVVVQADTGTSDQGSAILADVMPAFSYFRAPGRQKLFKAVRPIFFADAQPGVAIALNTDYSQNAPTTTPTYAVTAGASWGAASVGAITWNTNDWTAGMAVYRDWQSVGAIGFAAAARIQVQTLTSEIRLQSMDYVFESGGVY